MGKVQNRKDSVEILSKYADVIYKKLIIFLAAAGGSGAYAIKFLQEKQMAQYGYLFSVIFLLFAFGIFENFMRIKNIEKKIKELINE